MSDAPRVSDAPPKMFVAYGPGFSGDYDTAAEAMAVLKANPHAPGYVYARWTPEWETAADRLEALAAEIQARDDENQRLAVLVSAAEERTARLQAELEQVKRIKSEAIKAFYQASGELEAAKVQLEQPPYETWAELRAELAAAEAQRDRLTAYCESLLDSYIDVDGYRCCTDCQLRVGEGHAIDCDLVAALATGGGVTPPRSAKCRRFELNDTLPEYIRVVDVTPEGHATRIYAVVAQYSWAERILASGCFLHDADDIALTIGEYLEVNAVMAGRAPLGEGPRDLSR